MKIRMNDIKIRLKVKQQDSPKNEENVIWV